MASCHQSKGGFFMFGKMGLLGKSEKEGIYIVFTGNLSI